MSKTKRQIESIPDYLKQYRAEKGWSQNELANRAGIDRKTINRIENGKFLPSLETLVAISDALGVSVAVLLGGKSK